MTDTRHLRRTFLPVLAVTTLTACASQDSVNYGIAVQNKFAANSCAQILAKTSATEARVKQLEGLSARARQDTGGGLVATTVYGPDLAVANADLRLLRRARIEKKCADAPLAGR